MIKIRIIRPKLKEVGHFNQMSLAGYHDTEDDDRETRATRSRVVGETVKNENAEEHRN